MNTATLPTARYDLIGTIEGDPGQGWGERLRAALAASDAALLLLAAPGVAPDAFTLAQMAGALAETAGLDAVSPVGVRDIATAWALDDQDDAVL